MNDEKSDNQVYQDAVKVKKDMGTLVGDTTARLGRIENDVSQITGKAKEDLTTWVEGGVAQLSKGFEKVAGDARVTVVETAATVKKDVGHGLSQYNAKAKEVADKVPGGFSEKVANFPWVAMSITLVVGFLLGRLTKPARRPLW